MLVGLVGTWLGELVRAGGKAGRGGGELLCSLLFSPTIEYFLFT